MTATSSNFGNHRWHFYRSGGVDQVSLRDGKDVVALSELDPKLWVAVAMPVKGVELDPRTLELLDADKDGRIRVPEIVAAVKFVDATFKDPNDVMKGGDEAPLAAFKDEKVVSAARRALAAIGKKEAVAVSLADVKAYRDGAAKLKINGDGVLPPDSVEDPETQQVVKDILDTVGGVLDRGGEKGVDKAVIDAFFTQAQTLVDWHVKGAGDKTLLPLGEATFAAAAAVAAVRAKVDDYFTRCRLAAFDGRAAATLNGTDAELAALAGKQLSAADGEVAKLPLAKIEGGRALPLKDGVNPAWSAQLGALSTAAVGPLLRAGLDKLNEADWAALQAKLAGHEAWAKDKAATPVDKLGIERLKVILAGPTRAKLAELVAADAAQDALNTEIGEVERALRYKGNLLEVLNNFVNFSRFYSHKGAAFQAGSLILDARRCDLCLEVGDAGKHAALAGMAAVYLAYCDITRPGEKKTIVAAFTGGDADHLFVGRNGVFFDRAGRDWDATITKLVDNPLSVGQAFWSPYKKLARLFEEQVAKRAAAKDAEADAMVGKAATTAATADQTKAPEPPPKDAKPPEKKMDVGTVAAIGVAVGGIGTLIIGLGSAFFGLGAWIPLGLIAVILMISGPAMLLAWIKLRRRSLGPILDANGWAINGRAKINVPFGGSLTELAQLPKGAQRSLDDPYADEKKPWALWLFILIVLTLGTLWVAGQLDPLLPPSVKAQKVLHGDTTPPAPTPAK